MKKRPKMKVLVVDDHFVVRMGLSGSINSEPDMCVVAEAGDGAEAVEMFRRYQPDVTLMDLWLPVMTGVEATAAICLEFPAAKIVVLTIAEGNEDIWRALQAGARAYLLKTVQREELLKTIRAVAAGEHRLPPEVAARLAERMSRPTLTRRELEVLELIVRGKSNKEIGVELSISEITVKRHVSNLLEKLQTGDRTQAATLAIQCGIVHLP